MKNIRTLATLATGGAILAGAFVLPLNTSASEQEPEGGEIPPWLTTERAGEYLLIATGRDTRPPRLMRMTVYHVPTREVVAEDWPGPVGGWEGSSGGWGGTVGQLVLGAPNRLWQGASLLNLDDGVSVMSLAWERKTYVISADHRRAVIIEGGDIWRGELDWATGEIVNREQVTRMGIFNDRMRAIHWHGNDLYLAAALDPEKPVVRVNLVSGELEEIAVSPAFDPVEGSPATMRQQSMGHNPPGWLIVRPEGQTVHTLDLRTGRAGTLPNPAHREDRRSGPGWRGEELQWLDDTTAVLATDAGIFRFEFAADHILALTKRQGDDPDRGWVLSLDDSIVGPTVRGDILPDGQWVMVSARKAPPPPTDGSRTAQIAYSQRLDEMPPELFLLNLETGEVEPMDLDGPPPHFTRGGFPDDEWLDDRYYVFTRQTGGLAEIGTWLYDREQRQTRRLAQMPSRGGRLWFPESETIAFQAAAPASEGIGAGASYLVNVDGSGLAELPVAGRVGHIAPEPIDLGFDRAGADLWTEPEYEVETVVATPPETSVVHAEGPQTVGPTDDMRLEEAIADMSAEDQAIVRRALKEVQDNHHLSTHYDPLDFALLFQTEFRRLEPTADQPFDLPDDGGWTITWREVMSEGDLTPALSRERMVRVSGDRAETMSGDADWFTPEVKHAIGEGYADAVIANPARIVNSRQASRLFVEVLTEQRRLAQGHASPESAPTPAVSPGDPDPEPEDQSAEGERDAVDETLERVEQTADRIRGIFGR